EKAEVQELRGQGPPQKGRPGGEVPALQGDGGALIRFPATGQNVRDACGRAINGALALWMTRRALAEPGLSANVRPAVQMPGSRSVMMILRAWLAVPR